MSKSLTYTPPYVAEPRSGRVRSRLVFYLPGYDPEARSRYRLLFVRELTRYAKQFGQTRREIGRATFSADGLVQSWKVAAHPESEGARTQYEILLWDDIVARDFARSRFVSAGLLFVGTIYTAVAGLLLAFYRHHWKYGNVILYPFVMLLLLVGAAVTLGTLVHLALAEETALGWPPWVSAPLGILAGLALVRVVEVLLNRIYFWQLLNDWVFNWQHGQGWRPDYEARLERFTDHVLARAAEMARTDPVDEILIVGHSSGGLSAVEVAARVIARDAEIGARGPSLGLVTLGSGLPLVALQPRAHRLRQEIASLVTCRRIAWVDYGAPQDWMNFPGFNPVRDVDLKLPVGARIANPLVRSARFREVIAPETYRRVRFRPFRMHFQFLMSNDRPGAYDYFALTLGPQRLLQRVRQADRATEASAR